MRLWRVGLAGVTIAAAIVVLAWDELRRIDVARDGWTSFREVREGDAVSFETVSYGVIEGRVTDVADGLVFVREFPRAGTDVEKTLLWTVERQLVTRLVGV